MNICRYNKYIITIFKTRMHGDIKAGSFMPSDT